MIIILTWCYTTFCLSCYIKLFVASAHTYDDSTLSDMLSLLQLQHKILYGFKQKLFRLQQIRTSSALSNLRTHYDYTGWNAMHLVFYISIPGTGEPRRISLTNSLHTSTARDTANVERYPNTFTQELVGYAVYSNNLHIEGRTLDCLRDSLSACSSLVNSLIDYAP